MCNTPFCAFFVTELPFLQGADFFQPNCTTCRGFSCDSRKPAAECSLFAIQPCFPLPLAGKHVSATLFATGSVTNFRHLESSFPWIDEG